ncbi:12172_t:CDS:1, partial [Funneliformis caledonium]
TFSRSSKLPPLLPKAPQNPPLPPNFLQQNSLIFLNSTTATKKFIIM